MKMMKTEEIKIRPPFSELFPIEPETFKRIREHMRIHGFDPSQPVIVWDAVLIDGHTKLKAALENGIEEIPACEKHFVDENEAVEYAIHNQVDRRNLTDGDILRLVEKLDSRYKAGRPKFASSEVNIKHHLFDNLPPDDSKIGCLLGKLSEQKTGLRSSKRTAQMIGTSNTKVEKVRTILDRADSKTKEAVLKNKMSINKAYNKALKKQTSITVEFGNGVYLTIKDRNEFYLRKRLQGINWLILGTGLAPDIMSFPGSELLCPKREK